MIEYERIVKVVDSWTIDEIAYSLDRRELRLSFIQTKSVWSFYEVPPEVFTDLLTAESVGTYFNEKIRSRYDAVRVFPDPGDRDDSNVVQQEPLEAQEGEG